jgi:DNA-binding beta-propeller fold protein YncE
MMFASLTRRPGFSGAVGLLGVLATLVVSIGSMDKFRIAGGTTGGDARLLSFYPYPEMNGSMCELVPASASSSLQETTSRRAQNTTETRPSDTIKEAASRRLPIRSIRDDSPSFSAVALNLMNDEVVIQDENTYSIMVFNRLENTAPTAKMSEPKRWIRGENTQLEYNCSLYVDPVNGDIYSVNNDTKGLLTIFNRDSNGNSNPKRVLKAPFFYGIAMDEERQEMFLTTQGATPLSAAGGTVAVWKKTAQNDEPPLRFIQGNKTKLSDPHGIALDPRTGLIFVTNWGTSHQIQLPTTSDIPWGDGKSWGTPAGRSLPIPGSGMIQPPSITIYAKEAKGDAPPVRVIQGPKTQLNWPTAIAVDSEHGELFVANDTGHSVTVYSVQSSGDIAPIRVLKGPKTLIKNPTGITYDAKNGELWVANFGNHAATVYKRTAQGDSAPIRMIRSTPLSQQAPMMGNPHVVVYNSKRKEILVGQ